jgi:hypothetical protein
MAGVEWRDIYRETGMTAGSVGIIVFICWELQAMAVN